LKKLWLALKQSRQDRKRIKMLFVLLKRILKMRRLRLWGPCGAQDEFLLGWPQPLRTRGSSLNLFFL
jgi:hypothetical protein